MTYDQRHSLLSRSNLQTLTQASKNSYARKFRKVQILIQKLILILRKNSPFQEGVISEIYQRPDKSFFKDPQELEGLVYTGNLVQKFLPKQADIDKILKRIQRNVLRGPHLPVAIKEIQAGYLVSPYFRDIYLYLAQNKLSSTKTVIQKVEALAEKYILWDSYCLNLSLLQKRKQLC